MRKKIERKAEKLADVQTEVAKNAVAVATGVVPAEPAPVQTKAGTGAITVVNGNEVPQPGAIKVVNGKTREVHIHIHGPRKSKKDEDNSTKDVKPDNY